MRWDIVTACIVGICQVNLILFFPELGKWYSFTAVSGTCTIVDTEELSQKQTRSFGATSEDQTESEI
jgi:hypothetical protein